MWRQEERILRSPVGMAVLPAHAGTQECRLPQGFHLPLFIVHFHSPLEELRITTTAHSRDKLNETSYLSDHSHRGNQVQEQYAQMTNRKMNNGK